MPPAIPTLSSRTQVASPPAPDLSGARCQLLKSPLLHQIYLMFHDGNKIAKGSLINMIYKSVPLKSIVQDKIYIFEVYKYTFPFCVKVAYFGLLSSKK